MIEVSPTQEWGEFTMRRILSRVYFRKCCQLGLVLVGLAFAASLASPFAWAQGWQPSKPVEFVLPSAVGGAGEAALRQMVEIINKHKLASITLTPVFKPGASGGEAFGYFAKADPDHTLMLSSKVFYVAPLRKREMGIDITLYTPVATMGADVLGLWTSGDRSDINSMADFVKAVKAKTSKGENWTVAGMGDDSEDSLIVSFLNANYKLDMKYVSLPSGGGPVAQLVAKKVDSAINTVVEQKQMAAEGKTKPVVVFGGDRLSHFPNTPTLAEGGEKFAHELQRAISGPPNMSMEAQFYYAKLFRKVYDTPEWRAYRDENCLTGKFLSGPGLIEYWQAQLKVRRNMLAVIDIFKSLNTPSGARVR
jgi:putative tricarboxylic transport membrane protein